MHRSHNATFLLAAAATLLADALHLAGYPAAWAGAVAALSLAVGLHRSRALMPSPPPAQVERAKQVAQWQHLKTVGVFVEATMVAGLAILTFYGLAALSSTPIGPMAAATHHLAAVLAAALAYAFYRALDLPLRPERSPTNNALHIALLVAVGALAALLATNLLPQLAAPLLLMAVTLAGLDIVISRSVPTLYTLLGGEGTSYRGHMPFSRRKAVTAPALVGFSLLLLLLMALLLTGITPLVPSLRSRPAIGAAMATVLVVVAVALAAASRINRQPDPIQLFQGRRGTPWPAAHAALLLSLPAAVTIGAAAIVALAGYQVPFIGAHDAIVWMAVSVLIAIGPYGFAVAHDQNRRQAIDDRFPDFLRDVAASHKGGLTFPAAVAIASQGDYGPLNRDVRRMNDQLTWNISFHEALELFSHRVGTPLVQRMVALIQEAERSGGATAKVLFAAARDARELKALDQERRTAMVLYTIIIYLTFGVFLFVVAVLFHALVPQFVASSEQLLQARGKTIGLAGGGPSLAAYRTFYFTTAMIQAIGSGLLAGLMGSGMARLGLRHSFVMLAASVLVFVLVLA